MSFSLDSINIDSIFDSGGHEIVISGSFEEAHTYYVYIGDYKSSSDSLCYSGISDQGNVIVPEVNNTLYAYSPLLNSTGSTPYSVTVIDTSTLESHTLVDVLYVYKKQYLSKIYNYRKMLEPNYLYGPYDIREEIPN